MAKTKKSNVRKLNPIERELLADFDGLISDLKRGKSLEKKYSVRRLTVSMEPREYRPEEVVATRQILNVSQRLFAMFIGVSVQAVRAWEQGDNPPSKMARRLFDEIRSDPKYWLKRLGIALKGKQPA